jgi:hypothetical protein
MAIYCKYFIIYEENVVQHLLYFWLLFISKAYFWIAVIKLVNLRLNEIQWSLNHAKAWIRLSIDVFTNIFAAKFASLFYLGNSAILK